MKVKINDIVNIKMFHSDRRYRWPARVVWIYETMSNNEIVNWKKVYMVWLNDDKKNWRLINETSVIEVLEPNKAKGLVTKAEQVDYYWLGEVVPIDWKDHEILHVFYLLEYLTELWEQPETRYQLEDYGIVKDSDILDFLNKDEWTQQKEAQENNQWTSETSEDLK